MARLNLTLLMSHLACADEPEPSAEWAPADGFRHLAPPPARGTRKPCQFERHLPGQGLHPRPGAAGHRALWRQSRGAAGRIRCCPSPISRARCCSCARSRPARASAMAPPGGQRGRPASRFWVRATRMACRASLSSRSTHGPAQVFIGGRRCPVIGRVSMDMMAVDVTAVPVDLCRRGTRAELIGPNIAIDETAEWAGTISYELLTRLGQRFTRLYSGGRINSLRGSPHREFPRQSGRLSSWPFSPRPGASRSSSRMRCCRA